MTTPIVLQKSRRLVPVTIPDEGHPLRELVIHYMQLREIARESDRQCETIAPTPMTMAGEHPADALTGHERDHYVWLKHRRDHYGHAAELAYRALTAVVDNFGGL